MRFYGYQKCSTCRDAMKWLDAQDVACTFVPIIETPPTIVELEAALAAGFTVRKLFNTSGVQYRELKMKDKLPAMREAEALRTLAGNGYLVKRPFVIGGGQVTVGFKPDLFAAAWG